LQKQIIKVTEPYLPVRKKLYKDFDNLYETKNITNNGIYVQELEKQLKKYLGVKHLILTNNGTSAIQIALKALNIKKNIVTTPFSFVATTNAVLWEKIKPIYLDIDRKSFNLNFNNLNKIKNPEAVLAVHCFGEPCDYKKQKKYIKKKKIKLIFDASHAFGIKNFKTRKSLLNEGDISTLSFHATKVFHTVEGGAIVTNNTQLAKKIRLYINHGILNYKNLSFGLNAKMNEFQAIIGIHVLKDINKIFNKKKKICKIYEKKLSKNITFQTHNHNYNKNYNYSPVVFKSKSLLNKVVRTLNKNNIYPRKYFYPSLNKLKYILTKKKFKNSEFISDRILCLPNYFDLKVKDQNRIINLINKVCD